MRLAPLKGFIAAAALTAALGLAPAAAARYDDTVRCKAKTVRNVNVVTRSSEAAVFTKRGLVPGTRIYRYRSYACMFRAGPISYLSRSDATRSRLDPKLAGRFVAFRQYYGINEFGSESGIVVLDIRTGTVVEESPNEGVNLVSFVVKRNGSAAWIMVPEESAERTVWKSDVTTGGERQRLDAGSDIDAASLRLSGDRRTITWTEGGSEQSAPID